MKGHQASDGLLDLSTAAFMNRLAPGGEGETLIPKDLRRPPDVFAGRLDKNVEISREENLQRGFRIVIDGGNADQGVMDPSVMKFPEDFKIGV